MEAIFLKILNMSIAAGWLVLAIILLRLILKKAPRAILCVLWGIVGIRLALPFSVESVLSLIPSAETVPENIGYAATPTITSGVSAVNSVINPLLSGSFSPDPTYITSVNPMQIVLFVVAWIWVIGMMGMVIYTLISYFRLVHKVREAVPLRDNIRLCDHIDSPFILGMFRPRIYLPSAMSELDAEYVIAHEKAHLARCDHFWKPLGFLLLTIHWFNPLLWVAYILLCRDIELACDQKVIGSMGADSKKPYSEALINCSVSRKTIAACPLAFGEVGVRSRIKSVLNYKKPTFWLIAAAVITCVAVAVCFLTNPIDRGMSVTELEDSHGDSLLADGAETVRFVYGDYYYETPYSEDILRALEELRVSAEPIDTVTTEPLFLPFYMISIDGRNQLCFNHDLSECWLNGNVRPYSVYSVEDPSYVKALMGQYVPVISAHDFGEPVDVGGQLDGGRRYFYATVQEVSVDRIKVLAAEGTPEAGYANKDGTSLYVYTALMSASIPELKIGDSICVVYHGIKAETSPDTVLYGQGITLLGINTGLTEPSIQAIYHDSYLYDIDGDGENERCSLGLGPTSGLYSFTFTVSDHSGIEYYNCFLSVPYAYLRFETRFEKLHVRGILQYLGEIENPEFDLFEISIEDGNIVLTEVEYTVEAEGSCAVIYKETGERLAYWGKQGADS